MPFRLAMAIPSRCLSSRFCRSNSLMAAIMVSMSFPVGVPVSKFSLLLTRCTLLACNRSTISSRSLVLRARRLKSWISARSSFKALWNVQPRVNRASAHTSRGRLPDSTATCTASSRAIQPSKSTATMSSAAPQGQRFSLPCCIMPHPFPLRLWPCNRCRPMLLVPGPF